MCITKQMWRLDLSETVIIMGFENEWHGIKTA